MPFDVSEETLRARGGRRSRTRTASRCTRSSATSTVTSATIPRGGRRLVAFLGSTIGNLDPAQRRRFFFDLDTTLDYDDWLLLGTDLVKDRARLVAAYDDAAGVTAAFNRNVLGVLNRELGAHFDLDTFEHVALWNERRAVDRDAAAVARSTRSSRSTTSR